MQCYLALTQVLSSQYDMNDKKKRGFFKLGITQGDSPGDSTGGMLLLRLLCSSGNYVKKTLHRPVTVSSSGHLPIQQSAPNTTLLTYSLTGIQGALARIDCTNY